MATFKFGRYIDIHWNGYDIQGPAETVFSIPDQLYEEFDADIAPVEPTLVWIDTNEFQTLSNNVSVATLSATFPVALSTSTSGKTISLSSSTNPNGYLLSADGSGGVIFTPASTSGLTSVVGVSPISSIISGGTASVSLTGTYVNAVIGTSPASVLTASGTSTVSIDQAAITGATAATNAQVVRFLVKNTTGSTIGAGQAVYVSGATGDNALISLASATSDPTSSKTLGITAESIANDAFGYVVESGYLAGIDTSSTSAGAAVWLGNTPGSLVFVNPPAEPSHAVYLGVVARVQSINGSVLVKVQNGYELNELHDVFTTGVSSSLPLVYNSTSDGWIAQALSSVGIADNAIVTTKILDGAVTSAKIADNAVVEAKINAGAVTSAKIGAGAINSTHIGANAVVAGNIASNAVTSGNIAAGAVGSSQLADSSVVAAKIAAASVGTVAITSGSAANNTILTANGSGGASFLTASFGGVSVASFSATVNNTIPNTVSYTNTVTNKVQTQMAVAYDPANHHIYVAGSTATGTIGTSSMVYKIDASNGSTLASISIAMSTNTANLEGVVSIAFGSSKLCLLTNSSVSSVAPTSRWMILNSSLSTLATGNVHSAAQQADNLSVIQNPYSRPSVRYDKNANQFVIHHVSCTVAASRDNLYRLVDASTYTTGYYALPRTITIGASASTVATAYSEQTYGNASNIVYVPSLSRWVSWLSYSVAGAPSTPNIQVISFSQSTTTTAILSITGRQIGVSTNTSNINVAGGKAFLLDDSGTTLYGASATDGIKIYVSDISANINTNSSAGFTYRFGSSLGVQGDNSGKTNCYLRYAKNGSDEWFLSADGSGASNYLSARSIWLDDTTSTIIRDYRKNSYTYVNNISTNFTTDKIIFKDTAALWTDAVNTVFDIGVNSGTVYVVSGAYNTQSTGTFTVRVAKVGDLSRAIFSYHTTSDPTTMIMQTSYTNTDTTPISSDYPVAGSVSTMTWLDNTVLTGTYFPTYDTTGTETAYVMESGSSMTYYVGASVSSTATNTTTVKVLRSR